MKYSKFLLFLLAFSPAIVNQCKAMEKANDAINPEIFAVEDFDENRDMDSVTEIFKSDWNRLYIGRPFNLELVKLLLAKNTIPSATNKWIKVLRHGDKTVGFATYYFFNERTPKEGYMEIGGLNEAMRSKGIGSHFFPQILAELENSGSEILTVFVKKDNTVAHKLYEKFGFKIIDEHAMKDTSYALAKQIKSIAIQENTK